MSKIEVKDIERDLRDLEDAHRHKAPGEKLTKLLGDWDKEPPITAKYVEKWATELWKSKEQFEKELRDEYSKIALMEKRIKAQCQDKIMKVRQQCSFTVTAYERSLQQVKLRCFLDVERANMRLAEMESTVLSHERSDSQMNSELEMINSALDAGLDYDTPEGLEKVKKTVATMQSCIVGLQQIITTQKQEMKAKEVEKAAAETELENFT